MRTYKLFKHNFEPENYLEIILPVKHRAAFAKFRCGVAPIRLETGRFENISVEYRVCPICNTNSIENEQHALLECSAYDAIRQQMLNTSMELNSNFIRLTNAEKLIFILSNNDLVKVSVKTCYMILQLRFSILYK